MRKRRFKRIKFAELCLLSYGGRSVKGRLLDISIMGSMVEFEGNDRFIPGDRWLFSLNLGNPDFLMQFGVEVIHAVPGKAGFRFVEADLNTMFHLRNLLESRIGDRAMAGGEVDQLLSDECFHDYFYDVDAEAGELAGKVYPKESCRDYRNAELDYA